MEYELLDTGIFNDDRYFDVFVEYAKESPDDILIKITVCNRGKEAAALISCRPCGFAIPGPGRKAGRNLCSNRSREQNTA